MTFKMKTRRWVVAFFSLSLILQTNVWADDGNYTIPELIEEAKSQNYDVLRYKYQVFQEKEEVSIQMGKVVPHINFGALLSLGLQEFVSAAAGIVGFLFPSNWYDLDVARELYRAKQLKSQADIANILQSVEGLALHVHALEMLDRVYKRHSLTVEALALKAEEANDLSELTDSAFLEIKEFENAFERFHTLITSRLRARYTDLADLVGLSIEGDGWSHLRLVIMDLPEHLEDKEEINPVDCERDVFLKSKILGSFRHIYEAREADIESRRWRWLHPDADSEDSLILSTSARVNQGRALLREMWVQGEAAKAHLKNAIWQAANQYNTAIQLYRSSQQNFEIHQNQLNILNASLNDGMIQSLGDFVERYTKIYQDIMDAEVEMIMAQHQYLGAWSKLRRLHWWGPSYRGLEELILENISFDHLWWREFILNEQEEEGYEIEKFEIDGDLYEDGTIVLTESLLLPTDSFPHLSNGHWKINRQGQVEMRFTYKGKDYHALGTVQRTDYLFANTANFNLDIFDSENHKVGVIELTD